MKRRQALTTMAIGAIGALGAAQAAHAQILGTSGRTIRIVVGFPPEARPTRLRGWWRPHLEKPLKANVMVENKPGAGARLADTFLKAAKPDGNTLLLTSSSQMAAYPHVFRNLGYDPLRDSVPVTSIVNMEFGFVASTAAAPGVKTLREYVEMVKADGNYGGVGVGSIPHLLGAMLARATGIQLNYVPFSAASAGAQRCGQIPFGVDVLAGIIPHLSSGRVKLLATSGTERSVQDVPTVAEAGFRDLSTEDQDGGGRAAFGTD